MVTELNAVMSSNLRMGRGHGKILGGGMIGTHASDMMGKAWARRRVFVDSKADV